MDDSKEPTQTQDAETPVYEPPRVEDLEAGHGPAVTAAGKPTTVDIAAPRG